MMKENKKLGGKTWTVKKIAIVGLPNTGKSHVFNLLTGEYTIVANYPLTTVEIKQTQCDINGQVFEIFDTPGLHSLYIHSEEEIIIRDMLFNERPDILIQCIDANQVKQSLTLTADLMELGIPMAISLIAVEETVQKGIKINSKVLSETLGVPVVEIHSMGDRGTEKLKAAIQKAETIHGSIDYGESLEKGIAEIELLLSDEICWKRKLSILLLEDDYTVFNVIEKKLNKEKILTIKDNVNTFRNNFVGSIGRAINKKRNLWVTNIYEKVVSRQQQKRNELLKYFAQLCRHPVWGFPILIFFLFITFQLVVHVAGFLDSILSAILLGPITNFVSNILPSGFWQDFLIGDYGVLTLGLFNAIVTVLPILSVFFLMFAFLEDIGYMTNLCVLINKIFEKIGITGKSIMPLVLGFGCKTMATMTTRGLQSRKEKYIAIYMIAFAIPCAAQMGLNMAILGKIGVRAFIIAIGTLVFVEICAGMVLNKILKDDKKSDFIQELPPIRIPNIKAVVIKTYYRLLWFLKEAIPIFIIAALVLFFFDKSGGLDFFKKISSPIVTNWLGLPIKMVDALILTLARHEAASGLILKMVEAGNLSYIQCIVAVVITTMFVPCFANIVAMCKEMGVKTGLFMAFLVNISSIILAGILNWILFFTIG